MKWIELAHEYVISLFPASQLPEGMILASKKFAKNLLCEISLKIENNNATWYYRPDNWEKLHLALVEKIRKKPVFINKIFEETGVYGEKLVSYAKQAARKAKHASNSQLLELYSRFVRKNIVMYSLGLVLPLLDFHDQTFLSDELKKILKSRDKEKFFNLLTIPEKITAAKKQDLDLLKIAGLKKYRAALLRHAKKYRWVYYVYEGPAANFEYFAELLEDLRKKRINPKAALRKYYIEKARVAEQQKKIIRSLNLNSYETQIVDLTRESVYEKANRRELQSHAYCEFEPVMAEIAKRLNLSLKQARMMLPEDVSEGLLKNKVNIDELNQRTALVFYERTGKTRKVLSGQKVRDYLKKNAIQKKYKVKANVFTGTTAYPGKRNGIVRIINSPDQMGKMIKGDILVAATTNPNLMPAIRIAGAIVTDEGGLTCHAAIVSRELKIPCVVGTNFASRVLKDDDLVEVDAGKGIVKRL